MSKVSIFLSFCVLSNVFADEKGEGSPKHKSKRPDKARAVEFLKHYDLDSDGKVSREEFAKGERAGKLLEEVRNKLFNRLDKNSDGFITVRELKPDSDDRHGRFFAKADEDKDGRVSREEFVKNPPFAQADPERLNKMFDRMDRNSDGFLDGKDRAPGGGRKRPPGDRRPPRIEFEKLDLDQDGAISWPEFQKSPKPRPIGEEDLRQHFDKIDADSNGKLSAEEVKKHQGRKMKPRRPEPKK